MEIKIKKLNDKARIPSFANTSDAGMDLYSVENIEVKSGEIKAVGTGLSMAIPENYVGLIWDKSGLALKHGIKTMGGVIDAGYRGEIKVIIKNLSDEDKIFEIGDKITQMLIQKINQPNFVEVEELDETDRGGGGFGSSGK